MNGAFFLSSQNVSYREADDEDGNLQGWLWEKEPRYRPALSFVIEPSFDHEFVFHLSVRISANEPTKPRSR